MTTLIDKKIKEFEREFLFDIDGRRNWIIIREVKFLKQALQEVEKKTREETIRELTENALNKTQPDCQFFGKAKSSLKKE